MSYWVLVVDRGTGTATSTFVADKNAAWQLAVDLESADTYTTVVTATKP